MKTSNFQNWLVAAGAAVFLTGNVLAQDTTVPGNSTISAVPQLSAGVPEVLQLSQAKVGDSTIVNYVQNSGTIYALDANQIIYLKQQGVSDTVLNAMINQRSRLTGSTEPVSTTATSSTAVETPTAYAPPTATYVQSAPASTVYVVPDTQTYQYDDWYYSSYPYYYSYPVVYPAVSLSFGFGGHWGGGWRGGFHGGGRGGWHR